MPQPTYLTLEYDGQEKAFADWGFSKPVHRAESQASDRFSFSLGVAKAGSAAVAIPFDGWIIVRDHRTKGVAGFQGGLIIFQGARVTLPKKASPRGDALTYTFLGPWHDLETTYFQQQRNIWAGGAADNFRVVYSSEAALFLKIVGNGGIQKQNAREQITEIVNYAIAQGARLQLGTVDPSQNVNSYQIRDQFCAAAIDLCLRSCPDVAIDFDYETTPPTIHFRKRANRVPVTLPYADGELHQSSELTARDDLVLPSVSLYFKRTNSTTVNGDTFSFIEPMDQPPNWQLWPAGATGRERGNLIQTIDLQGFSVSALLSVIATEPFGAVGDANAQLAYWQRVHPQFAKTDGAGNPLTQIQSISAAVVTDDSTKLPVDLAQYPFELRTGNLAKWMTIGLAKTPAKWVRATVQVDIKYVESTPAGTQTKVAEVHTFTAPAVLTNAPSGPYESIASEVSAEEIPDGMAKSIFDSMAMVEYEGSHTIVERECSYSISLSNTLNLAGGDPAWSAMKASIRAIERSYEEGYVKTTVEIGPAPHLSAGDLVQLFLINRNRYFYFNTASLGNGQGNNSGKASTLGEQVPRENTNSGLEQVSYAVVHKPVPVDQTLATAIIQNAGIGHSLVLATIDQKTQVPKVDDQHGSIALRVGDTLCSDGKFRQVGIRELAVYDDNCGLMHQLFACSEAF